MRPRIVAAEPDSLLAGAGRFVSRCGQNDVRLNAASLLAEVQGCERNILP